MWVLAALIAALMIAMIYQESTGGVERPWAECKESMVQQMFSGNCTPRSGSLRAPGSSGPAGTSPAGMAPADPAPADPDERPVGEIKLK